MYSCLARYRTYFSGGSASWFCSETERTVMCDTCVAGIVNSTVAQRASSAGIWSYDVRAMRHTRLCVVYAPGNTAKRRQVKFQMLIKTIVCVSSLHHTIN